MFSTYDSWKLRSPDDDRYRYLPYYGDEEPDDDYCTACDCTGWQEYDPFNGIDVLLPCSECSGEVTLEDLLDLAAEEKTTG